MLFMISETSGWRNAARVLCSTVLFLALALLLAPYVMAATDVADQPDTSVLTGIPLGVLVVSVGMTLIGYVLNHFLPLLKTDAQKGVATTVYQAVGVVIFELATGSGFGLNQQTGVAFLTAMLTWGISHNLLFKPFTWSSKLGAGTNAQDDPA